MKVSDQHWLERLFPPRFSEEDFFTQVHQPEPLICEKMSLERAKRREELYNVAKAKLQEGHGLQRERSPSILMINEDKSNLEEKKMQKLKEERESIAESGETGGMSLERKRICSFKARVVQGAFRKCLFQLSFLKAELGELKAKCKKLVTESEQVKDELSYSRKAVLCKDAQLEQVQGQNVKKDATIEALRRDLHEKSENTRVLKAELQKAQEEILHLDLDKKDLQLELKKLKEQQDFERKLAVEKVKLCYDMEVRKIEKELEDAKRELSTAKSLDAKNAKALEVLKKHFFQAKTHRI
ncbi:LOW QUALITY PROTEIN: coiled-coil domain-containing protein 160 [Sceloporus undulatus]|uniref:LOW QUALITY PROTEIN: coiled-coil domain-containing protein 160 n=1 Tax=Sceloporus undulatus TaxID=8520 RepID=UPI001C4D5E51|nr:LOW QUALITY PROTEIN: coiled-coil domain-containing protein 160 [Sceloporus undulatus]